MTTAEAIVMIEEIESSDTKMNDWEKGFVANIKVSTFEKLTDKQEKCLQKIYEKITREG